MELTTEQLDELAPAIAWGVPNSRITENSPLMEVLLDIASAQYPELLIPLVSREALIAAARREKKLREAASELIEVADLRGDADLPHPADDPKTWTARMQTAWDELREALKDTQP